MTPRPHAEVIKAWADGATIQVCDCDQWRDISNPSWDANVPYRVKPAPVVIELYVHMDVTACGPRVGLFTYGRKNSIENIHITITDGKITAVELL